VTPTLRYLPAGAKQPRALGGGTVPTCSSLCTAHNQHRTVAQLDIGPARATFVWQMVGGAVYGTGIAWELRAVSLKGGVSTLLDTGLVSGTCGFRLPSAGSALQTSILYLLARADCDVTETSFERTDAVSAWGHGAGTRRPRDGPGPRWRHAVLAAIHRLGGARRRSRRRQLW